MKRMKVSKGELELGRFRVPYRVYGTAQKTIVCISGAKQTMAAWRSFVRHFVHQFSVVVFDLPGQGRCEILHGSPSITFDEQVDVLHGVVDATNQGDRVHLAAASWGTIISVALAAKHPELIDKMLLGSFGAKPSRAVIEVIRAGKELFHAGRQEEIAPLMIETFGQFIPETHKKQMRDQFSTMSHEQLISFYEHCEFVEKSKDIRDFIDLSRIKATTLIVAGEHDAILDHDDVADASKRIPDCELRVIPGAGHFLHWERADILNTYSEFLAA
ncbi:MAG: alpha/beta hydrolase [Pseudomonadota bacterium]